MHLLAHILVVAAVFVATDLVANSGTETGRLVRKFEVNTVLNRAKLETYHLQASLRQAGSSSPKIALVNLRR